MACSFFNTVNYMNATELFFSTIQSGKTDNIKLQLQHNPDLVKVKDARGFTALIFATYFDKDDITKILIDHNADVDGRDASGNTALIGVAFKGNVEVAKFLIEKGANVNAINKTGVSPLIFAAMYNQKSMIDLLIKNGVDKTVKDAAGKTASDYAEEKGFSIVHKLLIS